MKDDIENLLDDLPVELVQRLIDRYEKASLAYCYKIGLIFFLKVVVFRKLCFA